MLQPRDRPDRLPPTAAAWRPYVLVALFTAAVLTPAFLVVGYPPITDLPQQVSQVRLATEVLEGSSPYRFNLLAPGVLGYTLFAISWGMVGPSAAGPAAYLLLVWLWIGTAALAAREFSRLPAVVPIASLFAFSSSLYWGFASFFFGAVAFLVFVCLERRLRRSSSANLEALGLAISVTVLYSSHIFWFAAGAAWLVFQTLRWRITGRHRLLRLAAMTPALILVALWAPQMAASDFSSPPGWINSPLSRLSLEQLPIHFLGGLAGPVEPFILSCVGLWLALGLWQHRRDLGSSVAPPLLVLGGAMVGMSVLLPDHFQSTVHFAQRWAAPGAALLCLALPAPRLRRSIQLITGLVLAAVLSLSTTAVWKLYESTDLEGFESSLDAVPAGARLLGLDFQQTSHLVHNMPFLQYPAYHQAIHGGEVVFSFASFPSSPVVFKDWTYRPWARGIEWEPDYIFSSPYETLLFHYVLVHGVGEDHAKAMSRLPIEPVTGSAPWRLYAVKDPAVSPPSPRPSP